MRGWCDPGSMTNFITESCALKHKLPRVRSSSPVSGLEQMSTNSSVGMSRFIKPICSSQPTLCLNVIVLSTVCLETPSVDLSPSNLVQFKPFKLVDPTWHRSNLVVDVVLGVILLLADTQFLESC